ncbi:1-acyl-sn-glycerol-3-phosphate acyltransferase [Streptomyces tateyamensis]|uniref:1-acyl-sn-glycerol-3-phosphate acyltransferase n=1 Tax=Streptomyces tateyamensis TaxID=565073 RepID=A0A2V4NQ29_9ACTN|nr:lysophospholipid acyltransferase family protein [Streptomyces tateyamensis]PYC78238.1 1-acyl-sn-glycerol-3-phosphate acyltransferase [Streptomyces tateyamensis]
MLGRVAAMVVPVCGRLGVSTAAPIGASEGAIVAANHTSLADPAIVLAALHRLGVRPAVLATAGLWRIPVLRTALEREGCIPVRRGTARAAESLEAAAAALREGRTVLIYAEGGLPRRRDSGERAPGEFRSGLARLALATGAPVLPLGQAGARRLSSGSGTKQLAGVLTAPLRRPDYHVHLGAPVQVDGELAAVREQVRAAVTGAWQEAVRRRGLG